MLQSVRGAPSLEYGLYSYTSHIVRSCCDWYFYTVTYWHHFKKILGNYERQFDTEEIEQIKAGDLYQADCEEV